MVNLFRFVKVDGIRRDAHRIRLFSIFKDSRMSHLVKDIENNMSFLGKISKTDTLENEFSILKASMNEPSYWEGNMEDITKNSLRLSEIEKRLEFSKSINQKVEESIELYQYAEEDSNNEVIDDCIAQLVELNESVLLQVKETCLSGPYDHGDCFVDIVSGAGGTEACDWSSMLFDMYQKWADKSGFSIRVLDKSEDEDSGGGFRGISFRVVGNNSYGLMKHEAGVHRLVRISPFDPQHKRHTSFSQLLVCPALDSLDNTVDKKSLCPPSTDLRIETKRASGAGGQHINTTDSAIRITHLPTGIVVSCQNERSQHQNRATAMDMLGSRLLQLHLENQRKLKSEHQKGVGDNSWGNQIRSLVMQPYQIVKDHRTGWEHGNIEAYLNGRLLDECQFHSLKYFYENESL